MTLFDKFQELAQTRQMLQESGIDSIHVVMDQMLY